MVRGVHLNPPLGPVMHHLNFFSDVKISNVFLAPNLDRVFPTALRTIRTAEWVRSLGHGDRIRPDSATPPRLRSLVNNLLWHKNIPHSGKEASAPKRILRGYRLISFTHHSGAMLTVQRTVRHVILACKATAHTILMATKGAHAPTQ